MIFWFAAGMLTSFALTLVLLPFWRAGVGALASRRARIIVMAAGTLAFSGAAVWLYHILGSPESLEARAISVPSWHPAVDGSAAQGSAGSMTNSVAPAEPIGAADIAILERRVVSDPRDADAWGTLASLYRRQHEYSKAREAFNHLVQLKRMDADTWADQADVLASVAGGSLRGEPAQAIERALALKPDHAKALWLKASLAHEDRRYADAVTVWMKLRAVLPEDSSDRRIVDENIREATQLAAGKTLAAQSASPAPTGGVQITGSISVDSRLAARVPPGATLFIYAKAADSPGPPLAVIRQAAGTWPVRFRLDDSMAMLPTHKLSQFERVVVEARISRSGEAKPTAGDFSVTSAVLKPSDGKTVDLVIAREVG